MTREVLPYLQQVLMLNRIIIDQLLNLIIIMLPNQLLHRDRARHSPFFPQQRCPYA